MMIDDMELVRQYAASQSESAFAALSARHVNLVYSTALRHVTQPELAEEITQTVFLILARKAGSLDDKTILPGWLYRTTRFAALAAQQRESRRLRREHEAYMQSPLQESDPQAAWNHLAPLLDEAMEKLKDKDRDAVVLRFFENKSLQEVGAALGLEERAAQKRVARSLDKLRAFLGRRGVALSAAVLIGAISTHSVQAAPSHLAVATAAAAGHSNLLTAPASALVKGTLKLMGLGKLKFALIVSLSLTLAGATTVAVRHEMLVHESRESLDEKIVRLSKPGTTGREVARVLGEPAKYFVGVKIFSRDKLPATYQMVYANGVQVWIARDQVSQLGSLKPGPGFAYHGKLRLGSTVDEVLQEVGPPAQTLPGEPAKNIVNQTLNGDPGVLYRDLDNTPGYCYYWRPDQNVRFLFKENKVIALLIDVLH